jgi:hypothetical protein
LSWITIITCAKTTRSKKDYTRYRYLSNQSSCLLTVGHHYRHRHNFVWNNYLF